MLLNSQKARKLAHLEKINQYKGSYKSVVMISHSGLPSEQMNRFRDELFLQDSKILFIKNTIANLSFSNDKLKSKLEKSNFLIFSDDIFGLLKACKKFVKELKIYPNAQLEIMVGILDGELLDAVVMKSLESISSKEGLYVGLLGTLLYPIRTLVRLLDMHVQNNTKQEDSTSEQVATA